MHQVPVFTPTEEEFADFFKYLTSIESQVQAFGLCKIVPPPSWKPRKASYDSMDELEIPSPIRQYVNGSQGVYQIINVMEKKMTFGAFAKEAQLQEERGLKASQRRKKKDDKEEEFDQIEELERQYWKNLAFHAPLYGADMLGTLFEETPEGEPKNPWDLNHLDSLLNRKLPHHIPGVTQPYLYFGMWKAMFGCHTEDMELFSINYLHFGKPKIWYCAPPSQKERFERLAQIHYPHHFKDCSQFLRHKSSLLSPTILKASSITLTRAVQREGEFMITFPGAYHFGFNTGLNCAESVNFALESWVQRGLKAKSCQCVTDSVTIDMTCFDPTWTPPAPSRSSRKEAPSTDDQAKPSSSKKRKSPKKAPAAEQPEQLSDAPKDAEAKADKPSSKRTRKRTAKMPQKASPEKKRKIVTRSVTALTAPEPPQHTPLAPPPAPQPKKTRAVTPRQKPVSFIMTDPGRTIHNLGTLVPTPQFPPSRFTYKAPTLPVANAPLIDDREWKFSCMCGERVCSSDPPHQYPKGSVFECTQCRTWGHVNCYDNFANKSVDELPAVMFCHMCRAKQHMFLMKNGPSALPVYDANPSRCARVAARLGATIEFLRASSSPPLAYHTVPQPTLLPKPHPSLLPTQPDALGTPRRGHEGSSRVRLPPSLTFHHMPLKPETDARNVPSTQAPLPPLKVPIRREENFILPLPSQPFKPQQNLPSLREQKSAMPSASTAMPLLGQWTDPQQQHIMRGKYNCGRCGLPKKGHVCPFAESDAVVNPTGGLAAANAYPGLGSLPSRILGAPAMGQQVIMQQQSQIETIKQRLQQLQQMQEQNKRFPGQGSYIPPLQPPEGYSVQRFSVVPPLRAPHAYPVHPQPVTQPLTHLASMPQGVAFVYACAPSLPNHS